MPINPQTYEGVAYGLGEAGAQVTYGVAEALTELHKAVIENPENLSRAADIYAKHVAKASAEWGRNWRQWADEGLLDAYVQGVKHTDAEIDLLRKAGIRVHPPTEPVPEGAVMVRNLPAMTLPLDTPRWMKQAFVDIPNHLTAFNVFRRAAYFNLEGTDLQIIRAGNDLYRDVAIQAGGQMFRESDIFTRRAFSQSMLDDFAKRGVQAITYSNGRRMSIEAYSEMVGRTMSGHAAVQGSLNRYAEHGYNLVRVSAHFRACELCVPWEGRILSSDGRDPNYESLDSAISQGLFHPNCAHGVSPYIPGLSPDLEVRVSKEEQALIDKYGYREAQEMAYKAQVQQRHIERQIRSWKKRELTSLDPAVKASAHRKVLDLQKLQREHLQLNPFLPRKYDRESVPGWKEGRIAASFKPGGGVAKKVTDMASTRTYAITSGRSISVDNFKDLGGGVSETFVGEINGKKYVFKSDAPIYGFSRSNLEAELLADQVYNNLGMPVPHMDYGRYVIPGQGERTLSACEFVDGGQLASQWLRTHSYNEVNQDMIRRMQIIDVLVGNSDRHGNNFFIMPNGDVVPFDHNLAFCTDMVTSGWRQYFTERSDVQDTMTIMTRHILSEDVFHASKKEDYLNIVADIQGRLNDEAIDSMVKSLPDNLAEKARKDELAKVLKIRRDNLKYMVESTLDRYQMRSQW
jgi:hypothetical protein